MNTRDLHVGKSRAARETYSRYIKRLDYEPTIDEPVPFMPSNEGGEELKEPTSNKRRPRQIGNIIKDHFANNLANWIVGLLIAALSFLMVNSKIGMARIEIKMDSIGETIKSLIADDKDQEKSNHQQDLLIQENSLRIANLEKKNEIIKK